MSEYSPIRGLRVYRPARHAPSYVVANLGVSRKELIAWMSAQPDDDINLSILITKDRTGMRIVPNTIKRERANKPSVAAD